MVPFIDVHAHLDQSFYTEKELKELIERAEQAQVCTIIANGVTPQTNRQVLTLAKKSPSIKAALGLYPYEALQDDVDQGFYSKDALEFDADKELDFIRTHAASIVALGEVGLDYKTQRSTRIQHTIFEKIMHLSKEIDKPLIIHSRKAEEDVLNLLDQYHIKKVLLHCFCGKKKLWEKIKQHGWYCSIPTTVVKSQQFQELVRFLPLTQLFCETDTPFLSPYKDKKNEPAFVVESYKKIAEIKGMMVEEVAQHIFMNYKNLFG